MKAAIREIVETIALTILIFLLVRSVVQNFKVEGRSMEPTLESGQYLLINKAVYWRFDIQALRSAFAFQPDSPPAEHPRYLFGPPRRGDVVVFRYPKDPTRDFIKRVVGEPGDTVEIRGGSLYVNGKAQREPFVADHPSYIFELTRVPAGNYFVLGDNRNNSSDSHVWGVVPEANIIGKAWIRYWPPSDWGILAGSPTAANAGS